MGSSQGNGQPSVPGLRMFDGLVQAYTSAWRKYADTLNDVWSEVTSSDADSSSWSAGASKLLQAISDNVRDLSFAYAGVYSPASKDQSPVLVFVLDQAASASARAQTVPIPGQVDPNNIKATDLRSLGSNVSLPGKLNVAPNAAGTCLDVSIMNLVATDPKDGSFVSVIYEDASPPPKCALAVVLVNFLPAATASTP